MPRSLTVAALGWCVAMVAAVAGMLLPSADQRLSLGLFAFAVALALLVGLVVGVDGLRQRRRRRQAVAREAQAALRRLEYIPAITTGARRLRWRGSRAQVRRRRDIVTTTDTQAAGSPGSARPVAPDTELTGAPVRPDGVGSEIVAAMDHRPRGMGDAHRTERPLLWPFAPELEERRPA